MFENRKDGKLGGKYKIEQEREGWIKVERGLEQSSR